VEFKILQYEISSNAMSRQLCQRNGGNSIHQGGLQPLVEAVDAYDIQPLGFVTQSITPRYIHLAPP